MKIIILIFLICLSTLKVLSQKETFDLVTYNPPKAWKKDIKENNYVLFTFTSQIDYCQIYVMQSIESKGSLDADFDSEWQTLVVKSYNPSGKPQMTEVSEEDGWKAKAGVASFNFNNSDSYAILTTMSGFGKVVSILAFTNNQEYMPKIEEFLASVNLTKPIQNNQVKQNVNKSIVNSKYAFTTTNFDDGWNATVHEDWVEVTKGNLKVLIHYPKEGTVFPADPDVLISAAWNILVAPRYSNIKNYKVAQTITEYERAYLGSANLTDNQTGKNVYVVLFRKGSNWLEFVCSDKNVFINSYGFDPDNIRWDSDSQVYNPMVKMVGYNKFAVAVADFPGKWSNNFANNTFYSNIYTGASAGMSTYSSSETFEFTAKTYKWDLVATNSYGGNTNFVNAKASGTYSILNNWQIYFSDIEKKPKTYNAYFSCIKGARILWLQDTGYGDYTSYGRVD